MASWGGQQTTREVTPDPRPIKRVRATAGQWRTIRDAFEGSVCVHCKTSYGLTLHHAVGRDAGGDDVPENLVPLCMGQGTEDCHGKLERHETGWQQVALSVRSYIILNRGRCVYVVGKIGWDRFNSRYPLLSEPEKGTSVQPTQGVAPAVSGSESDWDKYEEPIWRYRPPADDVESQAVEGYE